MAKVASETTGPKFKKPLKQTTPPLEAYTPEYLARKAEVGEKFFTLKNGRQLCYFTEGDVKDPACLCLPAMGEGKCGYIFPKPLPGVYLIAVDRIGHGGSSVMGPAGTEQWSQHCAEILELVDSLGVDKFCVTGISTGGAHSMMMAAACPERVVAIAPVSAPCDYHHETLPTKADRMKIDSSGGLLTNVHKSGCKASLMKWFVRVISKSQWPGKDKTKDFGMAAWYEYYNTSTGNGAGGTLEKPEGSGGSKEMFALMNKDLFWVSKMMDSHLYGHNTPMNFYNTAAILTAKYDLDTATVKCPTFLYHGKLDGEAWFRAAEQNHKLIAGSELLMHEGHGHMTVFLWQEQMILALVKGEAYRGIPGLITKE
jgi:pimeloyl-ACP methyl ester carboxylesterase